MRSMIHSMQKGFTGLVFLALVLIGASPSSPVSTTGQGVYQEPADFLRESFAGEVPVPELLWITKALRPEIERILGHGLGVLRVRYWRRGERTAWILDQIGKDKPITTGVVVEEGRIERAKVLVFRESRGWEVRYPAFVQQFQGAGLEEERLDRHIDGITGATLSVRAVTRMAHLALYFHQRVTVPPAGEPHATP